MQGKQINGRDIDICEIERETVHDNINKVHKMCTKNIYLICTAITFVVYTNPAPQTSKINK